MIVRMDGAVSDLPKWDVLLERTLSSLDAGERDRLERLRKVGRRFAASGKADLGAICEDRVKAYLLAYSDPSNSNAECIRRSGTSKTELYAAYDLWPEFQFVRDYLSKCRKWCRAMDNEDMQDEARAGIRRMNTVDDCKLNAKTLIHVNERLDRENFGTRSDAESSGGRSQVTYVIPNLTVNNIMAPCEIADRLKSGGRSVECASVPPSAVVGGG